MGSSGGKTNKAMVEMVEGSGGLSTTARALNAQPTGALAVDLTPRDADGKATRMISTHEAEFNKAKDEFKKLVTEDPTLDEVTKAELLNNFEKISYVAPLTEQEQESKNILDANSTTIGLNPNAPMGEAGRVPSLDERRAQLEIAKKGEGIYAERRKVAATELSVKTRRENLNKQTTTVLTGNRTALGSNGSTLLTKKR